MKFLVSELQTHRFIEKEEKFDPKTFLGPAPDSMEYVSPIEALVRAELISSAVLVSGTVSTLIRCTCARCLTQFEKRIDGNLKQSIDEPEPVVEVDYFIKEAVILEFPLKSLCKEKCLGLCARCGQNKNEVNCQCPTEEPHKAWDALKDLKISTKQSPSKENRARRKNG